MYKPTPDGAWASNGRYSHSPFARPSVASTHHLANQIAAKLVRIVAALLFALQPLVVLAQTESPLAVTAVDEEAVRAQMAALLDARVAQLTADMDVADKVGQLFVINFAGDDTSFESDIAPLIHGYRIGGVMISPRYGNFDNANGTDTPRAVADLTNRLQALAYGKLLDPDAAIPPADQVSTLVENLPELADVSQEAGRAPVNIPLFVGVEQIGDSIDNTYLRRNFTTLPTQMALGATWNPDLAYQVGAIVGRELRNVGVNLLLGPNLDMLTLPRPDSVGKLGVDMYGGNPFWVSEMGEAYINGVHVGGRGQVLTVARHFPGQGDVDRLPSDEVATIQTNLDELRATALAPFQRVTTPTGDGRMPIGATDALMPSNMRYSAIQGTGPQRLPPLSLSPDLNTFLQQEGFADWRSEGLLMINALGLPAMQRHFTTESGEFPVHVVASNALLVGNDLIYLGRLNDAGMWDDERVIIEKTITFFQERYTADADFADAVDQALARILRAKLEMFTAPDELRRDAIDILAGNNPTGAVLTTALPVDELLALPQVAATAPLIDLGAALVTAEQQAIFAPTSPEAVNAAATVRQVARAAITALHPDISAPAETLPVAPVEGEKILIFTDSRLQRECNTCIAQVAVGPDDLSNIILRLYGPDATGQIDPEQIATRTFTELAELLDGQPEPTATATETSVDTTPAATTTPTSPGVTPEPEVLPGAAAEDTVNAPAEEISSSVLDQEIAEADWIIFNMLDVDPVRYPSSDAVKRFLRERGAELEGKQVIVLALSAPYFLDATEISNLSAYLGVYAKSQPFLENAVRVLFRSYPPTGAPPVSVAGTRFADLSERLQADPLRTLPIDIFAGETRLSANAAGSGPPAVVDAGSSIRVQVGPVADRNNHMVPDGTIVEFQVIYEGAELALNVQPAETRSGFAVREIPLARSGSVRIVATSGDATSQPPRLVTVVDPADGEDASTAVTPITPTVALTTGTAMTTASTPPDAAASAEPNVKRSSRPVNPATLFVAIFTLLITLSMLLIVQVRILPRTMLVHNLLWAVIIGLGAYIIYGVGLLPGGSWLYDQLDVWSAALVTFLGMIAPILWLQLRALRD